MLKKTRIKAKYLINIASTTAVAIAENKKPKVNDLVKKADYHAEIKYIKNKYFDVNESESFFSQCYIAITLLQPLLYTLKRLGNPSAVNLDGDARNYNTFNELCNK